MSLALRIATFGLLALAACADPAPPVPAAEAADVAAPPAPTSDAAAQGAVGDAEQAPGFALPDAMGREVRLDSLLRRGPVVLTFYRGAWCPYCNTQLRDYQDALDQIEAAGATLVAISPQTPDVSMTTAERNGLAFPVLSDVGNEVSRRYGLVYEVDDQTRERYEAVGIDLPATNGTATWELPVPATYVIGSDGAVRAAFVESDYTRRTSARQVLDALRDAT